MGTRSGPAPAMHGLRTASALLLLLLGLGCLTRGGAAATCGVGPYACPQGQGPASPTTACTTCDASTCCKDLLLWTTVTASPSFPARWGHCMVSVNSQLLVIAGLTIPSFYTTTGFLNDAWASATGAAWSQRTAAAAFSARALHGCVAVGNTALVIAGLSGAVDLADVWQTTDTGATFTQLTSNTGFLPRDSFGLRVFKNLLFVVAGWSNGTVLNDVWYSTTGATWTQITVIGAIFSPRSGFGMAVFNDQLYVVGGESVTVTLNDIWRTGDGATWTNVPQTAPIPPRGFGYLIAGPLGFVFCGGEATPSATTASALCWGSTTGASWFALPSMPGPLMGFKVGLNTPTTILLTGGSTGSAVVSTEYGLSVVPTCLTTSFTCPANLAPLNAFTVCAGTTCTQSDCCSGSLGASATQYLVIVLNVDCTLYTPASFAALISSLSGIPVGAIVITYFQCSSLTVYLTVLGSTPALANAGLARVAQVALSGALGPVVAVTFSATPGPVQAPTAYPTYPTVPILRPPSTSNPALLALLTLLVIPLAICLGLICSYARRPTCAMPVCCGGAQPMAGY